IQEAMAHGLPCVAVSGGGASLSITDEVDGLIVRNEPTVFADAVLNVLGDDNLYSRLADGAIRSSRESGTGPMTEQIVGIYRNAIAHGSAVERSHATIR